MNDTFSEFDKMTGEGWPADSALNALRSTYKNWITAHLIDGIDLAVALLADEVAA